MTQPLDQDSDGTLAARYGRRPARRVPTWLVLAVVVVAALLGWAVWAAFGSSRDTVGALVQSYSVRSDHLVSVTVEITRTTSQPVQCTVTATATDHSQVGEQVVRLPAGSSGTMVRTVDVRTERQATSADVGACR